MKWQNKSRASYLTAQVSPVVRQSLLHWAYELTKKDFDEKRPAILAGWLRQHAFTELLKSRCIFQMQKNTFIFSIVFVGTCVQKTTHNAGAWWWVQVQLTNSFSKNSWKGEKTPLKENSLGAPNISLLPCFHGSCIVQDSNGFPTEIPSFLKATTKGSSCQPSLCSFLFEIQQSWKAYWNLSIAYWAVCNFNFILHICGEHDCDHHLDDPWIFLFQWKKNVLGTLLVLG